MHSVTADRAFFQRGLEPRWRKYASVARMAMQRELASRATLIGRLALYGVLLLIFSKLWRVVAERSTPMPASPRDLLWYLAVTVRRGRSTPDRSSTSRSSRTCSVAMSYLGFRLAENAGDFLLRSTVLAAGGFAFAWLLAGGPPEDPRGLLLALPLGIVAGLVVLAFHAAIGLASIWITDSAPLYWVWQKSAFILGGLMLPLEVYPLWLRSLAQLTPFPALLNGPGRLAFGWQPALALQVVLQLLFWSVASTALLVWVYGRARRALEVSGG